MKAEYVDERDNPLPQNSLLLPPPNNMFSKFHPHQQQQPPLLHPHPHQPDSLLTSTPPPKTLSRSDDAAAGETIEVSRRPRGRPPGSKNKPKPPVLISRDPDAPSMSPYILEVPSGADIVDSLLRLTRRRGIGLCVLSGSGAVANVTLRQPGNDATSTVTFHGRFDLASISAVVLPGGNIMGNNNQEGGFTVTLSAPQGHIVGGKVVGPLAASGTVYVVAASFNNPTFHKLPLGDEDNNTEQQQQLSSPAVSGEGYNCHDVIWAPTARPPHHHPPPPPPPY